MDNKILFTIFLLLTFQVSTLAQPIVDLGQDTILCGNSLMLDAGNPGATFLWSDGSTTQTINADTTGPYWVMVTDLTGTTSDTIEIEFVSIPAKPMTPDTSVCGFPEILLSTNSTADFVIWSLDSATTPSLGQGIQIPYQVTGNKTLLIESKNVGGLDSTGYVDPAAGPSGNYFALPTGRGMRFDVLRNSNLESVTVYASAGSEASISLTNSSGVVLQTKEATFGNQGANDVYLDFSLTPGTNYRLILENPVGTFYLITSTAYSFPVNQVELKRGQPLSNQYPAFFNWKLSDIGCPSLTDTSEVVSLFQPSFDLGNDTILCSTVYTLDISGSGGVNYLWSDSSIASSISVDSSGLVWGESESSGCVFRDSVMIEILETPSFQAPSDTTICGSQLYTLLPSPPVNSEVTLWYDSPVGGNILSQDNSFSLFIVDTTTFYLERLTLPELDTIGYTGIATTPSGGYFVQSNERGLIFNVEESTKIISVDVFSEPQNVGSGVNASGTILVKDSSNVIIFSQQYEFEKIGRNTVYLNFDVDPGNNYKMVLIESVGRFYLTFSSANPFVGKEVTIIEGTPLKSQYNIFFNWRTARNTCSSGRIPVTVNIILPNQLSDSLYACEPMLISGPLGSASYLWSTGETTPDIIADSSQLYSVTASDNLGCVVDYSIFFELPKQVDLGEDGNICGDELFAGYGKTATILWSTGDTTPTIKPAGPGTYWVQVIEPRGCSLSDTITITSFSENPVVSLGNDTSVCTSFLLDTQFPSLDHLWSTGDTTKTLTVFSSGVYSITVTDPLGCFGVDTIGVAVTQIPNASFSASSIDLKATFVNSSGFGSYLWDFGDNTTSSSLNPVHTYSFAGIYTVRLIVSNECGSDTSEIEIQINNPIDNLDKLSSPFFKAEIRYTQERIPFLLLEGTGARNTVTMNIYDMNGRLMWHDEIDTHAGGKEIPLNRPNMPMGLYLITLRTRDYSSQTTFIQP